MGLAQLPRVYFRGFTYWNPSTMNNNDYQPTYDPASARLNWPWLERHGLQSADDFDRYVTQRAILATPNSREDPNINPGVPPAEWNFYGGNSCGFMGPDEPEIEMPAKFCKPAGSLGVTGYTNAAGSLVTNGDPWIGLPLRMNTGLQAAKLVDVDPVCPWSSQIFVDSLSLRNATSTSGFSAKTAGRAHARWLFLQRNMNAKGDVILAGVGSAAFQLGLRTSDIQLLDTVPVRGSLAAQVQTALAQHGVQGLMVRFVEYLTIYFQGAAFAESKKSPDDNWPIISALYAEYAAERAKYESGELAYPPPMPVNRAYSKTVGWIAPWMDGELRSSPGGRTLFPATAPTPLHVPAPPPPAPPPGPTPWPLGPAVIEYAVDRANPRVVSRLTIDLGSTIAELDSTATKLNYGTLQIALTTRNATSAPPVVVATLPYAGGYDQAAYELTSGVVDIPASSFTVPLLVTDLQNLLCVSFATGGATTPPALLESPYIAATDDRGVYVNEPDAPWGPSNSSDDVPISIQVRYLGGKPPAGARLGIVQYAPAPPGFGEGGWSIVSSLERSQNQSPYVELRSRGAAAGDGYLVAPVPHDDDGRPYATVQVSVRGIRCGPPVIAFFPIGPELEPALWQAPPTVGILAVTAQQFTNARVLPYHNALALDFENFLRAGPSIDVVSQRVFDEIFRTFFLMYPVMRFIRDPLQFQAWRGRICAITDPALFESASYMPVTRSLSAGQRRIIELWNAYADGTIPTPPPALQMMRRG